MHISKNFIGASTAAIFMAAIAIQSFGTIQAERIGYVQGNCPNIVKQALDTVSAQCAKAGRNKLCYGNPAVQADFQAGVGSPTFQAPGDVVDVSQIRQITLGGMDTAANTWGVAELKIQADLPDSDASQYITLILFGNTQLSNAASDANSELTAIALTPTATPTAFPFMPTFPASVQTQLALVTKIYATQFPALTKQAANRVAPTETKLAAIIGTATAKAGTPTATGTISALHETQAASTATRFANIMASAATPTPQATATLPPGAVSGGYQAMQAFYFHANDSAGCDQAPHDGLLIQSPQGVKQRITLNINGITVDLGSTVFVQAAPGKFLTVNTLEGSAQVTSNGVTQIADAGLAVQVPIDNNLKPAGTPAVPQFYAADTVRALPIQQLPAPITIVPGLPAGTVFGTWNWRYYGTAVASGACVTSKVPGNIIFPVSIALDAAGGTARISYPGAAMGLFTRSADNSYTGTVSSSGASSTFTFHFSSSTHIDGSVINRFGNCTYTLTYEVNLTSGTGAVTPAASALTPTP